MAQTNASATYSQNISALSAWLHTNTGIDVQADAPLSDHCTFHIGGPADLLLTPSTTEQLLTLLRQLRTRSVPYVIIGSGSNVLFDDAGFRGAVVLTEGLRDCTFSPMIAHTACPTVISAYSEVTTTRPAPTTRGGADTITVSCGAGLKLGTLCATAAQKGAGGLSFACGIPGSVGGAVFMNAGAYGGEMAQVVQSVQIFDPEKDDCLTIAVQDCAFGYRKSIFQTHPSWVILSATLQLAVQPTQTIRQEMQKNLTARREKQPLEYPSAGSVFRRYPGHYTAQIIEQAGLKGTRVGDAQVSEKHAGFIINRGAARAADVLALIKQIRETIYEKEQIWIEPEVRYIPAHPGKPG